MVGGSMDCMVNRGSMDCMGCMVNRDSMVLDH